MIQKSKFEYSPIGKVFNKGLDESNKKEGLLKKLKNIEDKSEERSKKDHQLGIKSATNVVDE